MCVSTCATLQLQFGIYSAASAEMCAAREERNNSHENKSFLAELPMTLRRNKLLFVHGSPNSQHEYLLPDMNAFAALERVETAGAERPAAGCRSVMMTQTMKPKSK